MTPRRTLVPSLKLPLEHQLSLIKDKLTRLPKKLGVDSVLLIGSCSDGGANYRSDIDLLMILKGTKLNYVLVKNLRDAVEGHLSSTQPLPLQINFALRSVFDTEEPAMQKAFKTAEILYDEAGVSRQLLARFKEIK